MKSSSSVDCFFLLRKKPHRQKRRYEAKDERHVLIEIGRQLVERDPLGLAEPLRRVVLLINRHELGENDSHYEEEYTYYDIRHR